MTSADLLMDAFGRIRELVHEVVADLTPEQLAFRVDGNANSIAWLVWHLTRIQDDHIAGVAETEQVLDIWRLGGAVPGCRSTGRRMDTATVRRMLPRSRSNRANC